MVRVDFNVPLNDKGEITDDTRIVETLPTIKKIIQQRGKVILLSHLGRPNGKPKREFSLLPVSVRLGELLEIKVGFAADCIGQSARDAVDSLKDGDCLMLENLRFHAEEETNDPVFSKELASHGDVFVNDAFGTAHRAHASTVGVTNHIPVCVAGYLMEKELKYLGRALSSPARPYVAILGGAKISGKIDVIQNLINKIDTLLIGGGMMFTFFKAMGREVGDSILDVERIEMAGKILESARQSKTKIELPGDCVITDKIESGSNTQIVSTNEIPSGWSGVDIGPETVKRYTNLIKTSKTIVWNGPMGIFEIQEFARGTFAIAEALAQATRLGAVTIVGGGDSAAAINQSGFEKEISHVSTGGGASLELLEGKDLPGVSALSDKR